MRSLLYLSNWGLDDGLTHSTVFPHLEVLQTSTRFERLFLLTAERERGVPFVPAFPGSRIQHVGMLRRSFRPALLARMVEYLTWPMHISRICREHRVELMLARGAAAGALAHLSHRYRTVPYIVESFEPHARYMLESGVWLSRDPRYVFQSHWESAQKRHATALLPVAESYRRLLIDEGVAPDRILTLPCTVDAEQFRFSPVSRRQTRRELSVDDDCILGVYVGKFGDNYYGKEAFWIFGRFAEGLPGFRMLVLTPMRASDVQALAREACFPVDRLIVMASPHGDVPQYLCGADVAFATSRPAPSRRFVSLVKVGEYWASGLPVVITEGIGDDSDIIREHSAGAVVTLEPASLEKAVSGIQLLLREPGHRDRIASLAGKYRSRGLVRAAYSELGLL
jgi:glycosyltransferase involved in cell wall biosynthesis